MVVNGWRLFQFRLFAEQLSKLSARVAQLASSRPETYQLHPATKLLATIRRCTLETIPRDPSAAEYRQGQALGPDNRHWFRAKFHQRFRLFFRFSSKEKIIVYVWLNDQDTLRKKGSRTDAYSVFRSMLNSGNPPQNLDALLSRSKEL